MSNQVVLLVVVFVISDLLVTRSLGCKKGPTRSPHYNLVTKLSDTDEGLCEQHVLVVGRGIDDSFTLPCSNIGKASIKEKNYLLYENPASKLFLFSDTPSSLIVIKDGECTRNRYFITMKKTIITPIKMTPIQCKLEIQKMKIVKAENTKHLEEWRKKHEEQNKLDEKKIKKHIEKGDDSESKKLPDTTNDGTSAVITTGQETISQTLESEISQDKQHTVDEQDTVEDEDIVEWNI